MTRFKMVNGVRRACTEEEEAYFDSRDKKFEKKLTERKKTEHVTKRREESMHIYGQTELIAQGIKELLATPVLRNVTVPSWQKLVNHLEELEKKYPEPKE